MPTQFDDLPFEIREEIFHTAFIAEWQPRVVEIFFKDGEIYSRTRPPPLLQICQLSRNVTLKYYKPWLPQFAGTLAHQPYEDLVEERGWENLSRLHNVCIDLHYDMLVINTQQWSPWDFGTLERRQLRTLAVNLGGWMQWLTTPKLAQQFTTLRRLAIFDGTKNSKMLLYKGRHIEREIEKLSCKRKIVPRVDLEDIPVALELEGDISDWITYKHPKKSRSSTSRVDDDNDLSKLIRTETTTQRAREEYKRYHLPPVYKKSAKKEQGRGPSRTNPSVRSTSTISSGITSRPVHHPRKRARDEHEEIQALNASRKAPKKSHGGQVPATTPVAYSIPSPLHIRPTNFQPRKFIISQIQDIIEPPREANPPLRTAQEALASIGEGLELAYIPTPEIRSPIPDTTEFNKITQSFPSSKGLVSPVGVVPAWPWVLDPPRSTFIHTKADPLLDLVDLRSSQPEPRPTPEANSSPIAKFKNPFEDWDDLAMGFTQKDLRAEPPQISSSIFASRFGFSPSMYRGDLSFGSCDTSAAEIIDLTQEAQVFQSRANFVNLTIDSEYSDDLSTLDWTQSTAATRSDSINMQTVQLEDLEIESTRQANPQFATDNTSFKSSNSHPDEEAQNLEIWTSSLPDIQNKEDRYTVKQILEERSEPEGVQYLVQWEEYTGEGDQTWISENLLIQIVPDLVMAWMLSKNDDEAEGGPEKCEPVKWEVEVEAKLDADKAIVEEAQPNQSPASFNERDAALEVEVEAKVEVEPSELEVINAEYIPERILGKKKFKGVPHYLVKWKGYELVKDRTWEPCERLGADVPWLVETFEAKKDRKKKK